MTSEGLKPDPRNIQAVKDFPVPQDVSAVRRFLGLAGYYRRFVSSGSMVDAPLFNLLEEKVPFAWSNNCQEAFEVLKSCLVSSPVMAFPDFRPSAAPFQLATDACDTGLGAVLSQNQEGKERVIGYASRTLHKAERNYSTTEKEALALVWAVAYFRHYLYGNRFVLVTDH